MTTSVHISALRKLFNAEKNLVIFLESKQKRNETKKMAFEYSLLLEVGRLEKHYCTVLLTGWGVMTRLKTF